MSAMMGLPAQPGSEPKIPYDQQPVHEAENVTHLADISSASPPRGMRRVTWLAVVLSLLASLFLFALDNTIVADVQPNIVYTLGDVEKLPWIAVSFALGCVSTNLIWGQLYCLLDNKTLFIASVILFEAGSGLCGGAPTLNALIVGRTICGVGGMGIYLGTMNMVSALTNETERPMYLGLVGLTWGIGTILGPIVGGAFADSSATWRWAFYINLCIGGLAAPVYLFLLPRTMPADYHSESLSSRLERIDLAGAVLSVGAITSLVMAVSFGGSLYMWNSGQIIALFVVTGVLWILFILQQRFSTFTSPANRLFPSGMIKSWELDILFAQTASAQVVLFVPIYFIPLYFQFAKGDSALASGVKLLPFVLPLVFAVMLNGAMMTKVGYYMPWYLVGSVLALIGSALLYTIDLDTSPAKVYGYSILTAFGVGLFSQAAYPVTQMKARQIQQAVSFIGFGQVGGITIALMLSNSIFLNKATNRIAAILPRADRATIQGAVLGYGDSFFLSLPLSQRMDVLAAIIQSINDAFVLVVTAMALSLILSLFMKREKLFGGSKSQSGI